MTAFVEEDDDDINDGSSHLPDILKPAAPKQDDGKNRGQNRLSAAERKRLKKGGSGAQAALRSCDAGDETGDLDQASGSAGGREDGRAGEVVMEEEASVQGSKGGSSKESSKGRGGQTKANIVQGFVGQVVKGGAKGDGKQCAGAGDKVGAVGAKGRGKKDKGGPPPPPPTAGKRGSNAKKKKLAKYADQDEEERAAALRMLGVQIAEDEDEDDAGAQGAVAAGQCESIAAEAGDVADSLQGSGLADAVTARLSDIIGEGKAARKDFDKQTLSKLAEFSADEGVEILDRFAEADILAQVKNKAAFLSGPCRVPPPHPRT